MSGEHKITKVRLESGEVVEGRYRYRGAKICRNDREKGYSGHWTAEVGTVIQGTRRRFVSHARGHLLAQIDAHFDGVRCA